MKNKHPKRKLAIKMLTKKEREEHINPFNGLAWEWRKDDIRFRVRNQHQKHLDKINKKKQDGL